MKIISKFWAFLVFRIVERGFYSERDAAHVVKQILEAVSVSLFVPLQKFISESSSYLALFSHLKLPLVRVGMKFRAAGFQLPITEKAEFAAPPLPKRFSSRVWHKPCHSSWTCSCLLCCHTVPASPCLPVGIHERMAAP